MTRFPRILLLSLLFAIAAPAHAAGLPDTGQDTCYNDTAADGVAASNPASIARDAGTHPRQDCRYGRDAAAAAGQLTKTGGGAKGFDYSRIANNGLPAVGVTLGIGATDWACTKDNTTGLTWEVKTTSGLRSINNNHTWYNNLDPATNGGNVGDNTITTSCNGTLASCNTEAYVTAVNASNAGAGLCNATDWRMPTQRELLTLVVADGSSPSIDPTYFPNSVTAGFWSGSSYVPDPAQAWVVNFLDGSGSTMGKGANFLQTQLVRGAPF